MQKLLIITLFSLSTLGVLVGCAPKEVKLEGERFDVRSPLAASLPNAENPNPTDLTADFVNKTLPVILPAPSADLTWSQRGGNVTHTGHHGVLSKAPALVWRASIGQGNSRNSKITAAPVVAEGVIFAIDADNRVSALNSQSGTLVWQASLAPQSDGGGSLSTGGLAYGSGKVFAGSAYGELLALDAKSGTVLWRQNIDAPIMGAPAVDGNTIYVVGRDSWAWAIDASSGKVKWQIAGAPAFTGMIGSAAPAVTDSAVIFPFVSGELAYALKVSGEVLWNVAVSGGRLGQAYATVGDITGDPVVVGDRLYVGNQSGRSMALDLSSGDEVWSAKTGAYGPMLVHGKAVFLVSDQGALMRLDRGTGERVWAEQLPNFKKPNAKKRQAVYAHFGPVLAGGRLVVASSDGYLRSFDPASGTTLSSIKLPAGAAALPALAGDMLYILTTAGEVLAFR